MIRQDVEKKLGLRLSDSLFKHSLDMATKDIKFNRIAFKKRTTLKQAIEITAICALTALRYE
ncbi:MAG: hypothetical protein Q8900_12090 [Bacillota bacterium]|nr:hypothetical protein [Bacillota bacterium]